MLRYSPKFANNSSTRLSEIRCYTSQSLRARCYALNARSRRRDHERDNTKLSHVYFQPRHLRLCTIGEVIVNVLKAMLVVLPVFLAADAVWIGYLMKSFYDTELGDLARRSGGDLSPRWAAAIVVYILIPSGIVLFVRPLLGSDSSWWHALGWGAAYGLIVYGVYDLTNRAVLDQWSLRMTIVDIIWGSTLCAVSSVAMWSASGWWLR